MAIVVGGLQLIIVVQRVPYALEIHFFQFTECRGRLHSRIELNEILLLVFLWLYERIPVPTMTFCNWISSVKIAVGTLREKSAGISLAIHRNLGELLHHRTKLMNLTYALSINTERDIYS